MIIIIIIIDVRSTAADPDSCVGDLLSWPSRWMGAGIGWLITFAETYFMKWHPSPGPLGLAICIFGGLGTVDVKMHGFKVPKSRHFDGFGILKT